MKAALMTIFQVPNYGSVLQAFATQMILEQMGYSCDLINYHYPNKWHFRHGFEKPGRLKSGIKKFAGLLGLYSDKCSDAIERFRTANLNLTHSYPDLHALEDVDWMKYDVLVSGSDQVWNPRFHKGDSVFCLSFARKVKKISLASSFACNRIPEGLVPKYKKYLNDFEAISVREKNGIDILQGQIGYEKEKRVLLDPTLLISGNEWIDKLNIRKKHQGKRYILLYILDYSFNPRPYILDVAEYMRCKYDCEEIITFSSKKSPEVIKLGAKSVEGCSVEDFVAYFKNAYIVVTSSFHGTAFAINFSKPIVAVRAFDGSDDRLKSLLDILGISQNCVTVGSPLETIEPFYEDEKVRAILQHECSQDLKWLKNILIDSKARN